MSKFNIDLDVRPEDAYDEIQREIAEADLSVEDAQAARNAMNAVLAFLNDVGDQSVDPGVSVSIQGESGRFLTVSVDQISRKDKDMPHAMNVPSDDDAVEEPKDKLGYAVAGQYENPRTGDPVVDNTPGHPDAPGTAESVPEPQDIQDPQVEEMLAAHDAEPELVDVENPLYHTSEEALEAVGDKEGVVVDTEGSANEVIDSVGDDKDRARAALDAENASDKPRKRLVADLQKIIDS